MLLAPPTSQLFPTDQCHSTAQCIIAYTYEKCAGHCQVLQLAGAAEGPHYHYPSKANALGLTRWLCLHTGLGSCLWYPQPAPRTLHHGNHCHPLHTTYVKLKMFVTVALSTAVKLIDILCCWECDGMIKPDHATTLPQPLLGV